MKHVFASARLVLFILNSLHSVVCLDSHTFVLLFTWQWNWNDYSVTWHSRWKDRFSNERSGWKRQKCTALHKKLHLQKKKLHFLSFLYLIPSRHSPGKSCYFAHWCRTGPNLCCCCIRCNNAHTHKCTQLKCIIKHRVHSVLKPQRGFGKLRLVIMLPNNPFDCKCLFWFTVCETKRN